MKTYAVHSSFLTIQGEGYHAGRRAVFIRFSGCNVWNGREKDRERDAIRHSQCARICDTKFFGVDHENGGGHFSADEAAHRIRSLWGVGNQHRPFIVLTGGEPGLQVDEQLIDTLKSNLLTLTDGYPYIAIETNGSCEIPGRIDWVTISPKPPMMIKNTRCDELKVLYPLYDPYLFKDIRASRRYIQPVDYTQSDIIDIPHPNKKSVNECIQFIMKNPEWRISCQMHKILGIQ